MAGTATATYTTDVWTSPSVDGSQWEYAVPIRQDSTNHRSKSRSSRESHARSKERNSKGSRSSSLSRHAHGHEHFNPRGRREFSHSRRGSEAESSRSIYGHDIGSPRAGNVKDSVDALYRKGSVRQGERNEGIGLYMNEFDQDNWIHRDKLAKIESEELHQAAILLQRRAGAEGNKTGRSKNHDSYGASPPTELEPWPSLLDDPRSPTLSEGGERQNWDLRRPEEIAAEKTDDGASGFYRNPGQGKSSSRIPVPTASPATTSPGQAGREFPIQRKRASTNGDDEVLSFGMPRRASEPMSVDSASNITPAGSRPGSRGNALQNAAGKKTTAKGATNRKTSAPPATRKATPRSRVPSSTQRTGKNDNRPINRPEGDPPWLATMYKPDPRLPPEQQILPTHARRMQQEQWVKEGKTPTTYDREFAPLAIGHDGPIPMEKLAPKEEPEPASTEEKEKGKEKEKEEPVPQKSPSLKKSPSLQAPKGSEPGRPNSSTGYSTMPRVQEPPMAALQPKWSPPVVTAQEPPPKEKGCGCCIVM
ncbi:hypothetical protein BO94DRAFT_561586 [Aspergillus sclerotioniger CBS 115572]|uniref:TeaA receptor TeaR n=1 Tax=Aspergillus sclerotioniger CBS 115572 TaxID=1450535 RepID=A0A317UXM1_9EURO|nr:hypothetical protein BO94DRAFT_561586 [Aspergillus sclerotioniger CBS 115572]PWY65252.1 hypothetical protein BO94DRAFT_561586 [Aspergillus sclerotioniger CBS 115572]